MRGTPQDSVKSGPIPVVRRQGVRWQKWPHGFSLFAATRKLLKAPCRSLETCMGGPERPPVSQPSFGQGGLVFFNFQGKQTVTADEGCQRLLELNLFAALPPRGSDRDGAATACAVAQHAPAGTSKTRL